MRVHEVLRVTALSKATLWRLEKVGAFPKRRRLSPGAVGWLEAEVFEWMNTRTADSWLPVRP